MNFYYYLYSCAYWVSVKELKEKASPQEYAFLFVSIIDFLLVVSLIGLMNLYMGRNIMTPFAVILVAVLIAIINYFLFINRKRFKKITESFSVLSELDFKKKRIRVMTVTFISIGLISIFISIVNNMN